MDDLAAVDGFGAVALGVSGWWCGSDYRRDGVREVGGEEDDGDERCGAEDAGEDGGDVGHWKSPWLGCSLMNKEYHRAGWGDVTAVT